jgi:hypothetical protein
MEQIWLPRGRVKPRLTLADVIVRRVPMAPKEAATVTLAVAREWDRRRALHGPLALPDVAGIELTERGEVSFLILPPPGTVNEAAALAALLARLLGIDRDSPRPPIPGGLLIAISGRLGNLNLPSATPEGFRAALARFADEDDATMRSVYWRSVTTARSGGRQRRVGPARIERRAMAEQVSELRRGIRALEQRVFETEHRRPAGLIPLAPTRRTITAGLAVLAVTAVLTTSAMVFGPEVATVDSANTLPAVAERPATPSVEKAITPVAAPVRAPRTTSHKVRVRNRSASLQPSTSLPVKSPPRHAFAGGTRGIAWLGR